MNKTATKSHIYGSVPNGCWCGTYHYTCSTCGFDCTIGTSAGPATTDTRGVTRCYQCNEDWERLRARLSPWTAAEAEAIKAALMAIAPGPHDDPYEVTSDHRKVAAEILARTERAGQ